MNVQVKIMKFGDILRQFIASFSFFNEADFFFFLVFIEECLLYRTVL